MSQNKLSLRDICLVGIFVAKIVAISQLAIPLAGGVPITLQTFVIPFTGAVLGAKRGALAALIYVLLGAAGLPVFAHFQGGLHVILGPTGGYILSYPLMAFIAGFFADKNNRPLLALGLFFGFAVCLAIGMLQFALILGHDLQTAFLLAVAPFIPVEALKMAAVFITAPIIRNLYNTRR